MGLPGRPARGAEHPRGHHPGRLDADRRGGAGGLLPQNVAWIVGFLLVVRFLFGVFQAGTFPAISRMISDWIPINERGGAQGLLWMSSRVGGATAPYLLVWLIAELGDWKAPLVCGGAGFRLVLRLLALVSEPARGHGPGQPGRARADRLGTGRRPTARHGAVPWKQMFRTPSVVALCAMYGCLGYSGNFFLTLLPTYLKNHRNIDSKTAGLLTSAPLPAESSRAWRGERSRTSSSGGGDRAGAAGRSGLSA